MNHRLRLLDPFWLQRWEERCRGDCEGSQNGHDIARALSLRQQQ